MYIDLGNTGNNINFAPGGGGCKLEPRRAASIRENGIYKYDPAEGYDGFEGMDVDVDVPQSSLQENKTVDITANGSYGITPDQGYDAMKKGTVNVNVPIKRVEASKTVTYTENGDYTLSPSEGYDGIAGASVKVNVTSPTPVQTIDLDSGISFSQSLFTTMPFALTGGGNRSDIKWMFKNCLSLTNIDLSNIDTGNVTNMNSVFDNCSSLTSLDLSNFNTEKVTDMSAMFQGCTSLASLNISSFSTKGLLLDFKNSATFNNTGIVNLYISSKWFENPYLTTYNFTDLNKWTGEESIAALVAALPSIADVGQKTLTLSEATKNVLTDAQKSLIEEKGWILS